MWVHKSDSTILYAHICLSSVKRTKIHHLVWFSQKSFMTINLKGTIYPSSCWTHSKPTPVSSPILHQLGDVAGWFWIEWLWSIVYHTLWSIRQDSLPPARRQNWLYCAPSISNIIRYSLQYLQQQTNYNERTPSLSIYNTKSVTQHNQAKWKQHKRSVHNLFYLILID